MRTVLILCSLIMVVGLSGCETVKGFGKDLQNAGEALEKKSDE